MDEIASLRSSMVAVADTNQRVLGAMGQRYSPNVTGPSRPRTAEDLILPEGFDRAWDSPTPTPAVPEGPKSLPERARAAAAKIGNGVNWAIGTFGETGTPYNSGIEEGRTFGAPATGIPIPRGPSSQGRGGGPVSPGDQNNDAWLSALRPRADIPITMPRYGEFNAQDVLGLFAQVGAKYSVGHDGRMSGRAGARGVGLAGGALDAMSDVVPYFKALEQGTGIGMGPRAANAQTSAMGYDRGGLSPEIFGMGFSLPFGPAFREATSENIQATRVGLGAGISIKEARAIQDALKGQGYSGEDRSRLTKVVAELKADKNTSGDVGSVETLAPIVDQLMRHGATSLGGLKDAVKGLGEEALASRMTVDELNNSLNEFANEQQKKGATYGQGRALGRDFNRATGGLDPRLLSQLQDNGIVQGMFMRKTGMLPQEMGIAPAGAQISSIYEAMDLVGGAFKGLPSSKRTTKYGTEVVSGEERGDAMAAKYVGLDTDVYMRMKKNRKKYEANAQLEGFATRYGDAAQSIHDSKAPASEKASRFARLYKGQEGVLGMDAMGKAMKDAGFSGKEIADIGKTKPWERAEKIHELVAKKTGNVTDQDKQTVTISASPELRRWLRLHTPDDKSAANEGKASVNIRYANSNPRAGAAAAAAAAQRSGAYGG